MDIDNEDQSKDRQEIKKPIRFISPETVVSRFSNFALVQRDEDCFTISFFEIQKPPLMGTKEERKEAIEKLEFVPAVCVARIVATPSHFKSLIAAMQKNLEGFEKNQK
jgi:hypothetical protein